MLSLPGSIHGVAFRAAPFGLSGPCNGVGSMTDVLLIGAALAFFTFCFVYVRACDRL